MILSYGYRILVITAAFFALMLATGVASSHATASNCTVYVSPAGGGNGSTPTTPTTFATANSAATPGSVICLKGGTYNFGSNFILNHSGTAAAKITYEGYGDSEAVLQYTGANSSSGGIWQTPSVRPWGSTHDIVIQDLTFDGANKMGSGIFFHFGSHHDIARRNTIRNTGSAGINLMASDYMTVDHNLISHFGYVQGDSSGVTLWYGGGSSTGTSSSCTWGGSSTAWYDTATGFHNVIADNIISGGYDAVPHTDGNGIIVDGCGSIPPALIINNLTFENGGRGIEMIHNTGNVWVINNTAYANGLDLKVGSGQAPDFMALDTTNTHWFNNIAYGRKNNVNYTTAYIYNNTTSTIQWKRDMGFNGSTPGVSSTVLNDPAQFRTADPLFNSRPAVPTNSTAWASAVTPWSIGNAFILQDTSPAIDIGVIPADNGAPTGLSTWWATDLAGNPRVAGSAPDLGAYEQAALAPPPDTTPPDTTITSAPNDSESGSASISFSANEPSTFQCAIDGGAYSPCSSPATYSGLGLGSHTFLVKATDTAGNPDTTPAQATWSVVDNTPPNTVIDSGPADVSESTSDSATFVFHSTESGSTFRCALDGASVPCASPVTYNSLSVDSHTFQAWATDASGNEDVTPDSRQWFVNEVNSAPTLNLTYKPSNSTLTANVDLQVISVEFYVNDVLVSTQSSAPYTYTVTDTGSLSLKVVATEADGDSAVSSVTVSR